VARFVHILNYLWPYVVAAMVAAAAAWVGFKLGRRYRREWREAKANRNEYHALKADAQLRAATSVKVRVDASPVINVGTGLQSNVREQRHGISDVRHNRVFCSFCGRFGCGATCREAVESGRANDPIFSDVDEFDSSERRGLVHRTTARVDRSVDHHRHGVRRERSDDLEPWDGVEVDGYADFEDDDRG
jgi:hypothetical protein